MGEKSDERWKGKAVVELADTNTEVAWSVIEDFCNIHKWMSLDTSYQQEGTLGKPGLIRYCASTIVDEVKKTPTLKWAKEKVLAIDPVERSLSYEVIENNMGFKFYVATLKVLSREEGGCKIEWGFVCDPVEGWTVEGLESYVESSLQIIKKNIQLAYNTP
ncbi:hypothetical protein LR48_Vigan04g207100 [Vigna angularis]|uniref:Bet v I/Major latex protein domain-containing protein n=2 Tax=Phaseolus angularis TaxID=3914 RepID=A0A0L9UGJ5_PHAAN|nr:lachrymatory-factor synthase [Vigna angularis]XP_052731758.1 lachrymatory-factor synthase [Vigna angularis]KAG2400104.1 uncharacterized protein HKW66_Vig0100420 [Vigna angularis]KOM41873.1 hypothetical protein LR48_Vigan04g207100 [Vigna angularis]BAT78360.1 hypothetical protein VIGAN_02102600 [Vigna angularis var. angularis]